MSSEIYLVIKESGEYSSWTKENICFYTDRADAEEYVQLHNELLTIESAEDNFREPCTYYVEVVKHGKIIYVVRDDVKLAARNAEFTNVRRKTEKAEQKKAVDEKWAAEKDAELKELAADVNKFLDWWEGGSDADPYFELKKLPIIRSMKKPLPKFVELTNDTRAAAWLSTNRELLA